MALESGILLFFTGMESVFLGRSERKAILTSRSSGVWVGYYLQMMVIGVRDIHGVGTTTMDSVNVKMKAEMACFCSDRI